MSALSGNTAEIRDEIGTEHQWMGILLTLCGSEALGIESHRASVKLTRVEVNFMSLSQFESRIAILLSKLSLSWLPSILFQKSTVLWILIFFFDFWSPSLSLWGYISSLFLILHSCWNGIDRVEFFRHFFYDCESSYSLIHICMDWGICVCEDIFKLIGESYI